MIQPEWFTSIDESKVCKYFGVGTNILIAVLERLASLGTEKNPAYISGLID